MQVNSLMMLSADPLARALAQRDIDPNEVAKTFTHLRALYERAGTDEAAQRKAVAQWWRWLETVAGPGARAVIRSGRTQGYYRAIQDVYQMRLRELESEPEKLVQALGWAVRLMRYYQSNPDALDKPGPFGEPPREQAPPERKRPPEPKAPQIPAVGDTYTGQVLQIDESAVVVAVPGFEAEQAIGMIKAEDLGGRRFREGNAARVEVIGSRTLKNGRTVLALKPAKREGNA